MNKLIIGLTMSIFACVVYAEDIPIVGNVQSKCVIIADTQGVYGNSTPSNLSTDGADGGVRPVVRYDVLQADAYKAIISHPNSFTESPPLDDVVNWEGSTSVSQTSDTQMSAYDTNKIEYNNSTEYDLTVAGSTWFSISSEADYGFNKAFPGGTYRAVVEAECIAK
jgi:hypothetical protein